MSRGVTFRADESNVYYNEATDMLSVNHQPLHANVTRGSTTRRNRNTGERIMYDDEGINRRLRNSSTNANSAHRSAERLHEAQRVTLCDRITSWLTSFVNGGKGYGGKSYGGNHVRTITPFLIQNAHKVGVNELKGNGSMRISNAQRCNAYSSVYI